MSDAYVHGYQLRESERLQDQAGTLVDLLHSDTSYPPGSIVLEAGCGVGAQTVPLARNSPGARITSVDLSTDSVKEAKARVDAAGLTNVELRQADIFALPYGPESFDHIFVCFVLEHLSRPFEALTTLRSWVHWRWQCPKFLRQTFVEWAAQTINKSFWAGAYYRQQRVKGSSHQAALRALAFKWIRILYRCWQTKTPYDESKCLHALKRRGSPLLNSFVDLAKNT
jgi:cyclopropane fatty-acyl-phospholipid synthase-like methyltransferase